MKTLLYCTKSWRWNNWLGLLLAGVWTWPLTCPPITEATFPYHEMSDIALGYIALHGALGMPDVLFGDEDKRNKVNGAYRRIVALAADKVRACKLNNAIIILEGCYGMSTHFPDAFVQAGASAVVASVASTYDRLLTLGNAGRFGMELVRGLLKGQTVQLAVEIAKYYSGETTFQIVGNNKATVWHNEGAHDVIHK